MNIIIFFIIVTILSGGIGYGVWSCFAAAVGKMYPKLCYRMLKLTSIFLFFPIVGFSVLFFYQGNRNAEWVFNSSFMLTAVMERVVRLFFGIWILLTIWNICKKCKTYFIWKSVLRCSTKTSQYDESAERVRKVLGLKKCPDIYVNPVMDSPSICGVRHGKVILPSRAYTSKEMKMILFHEFCHYKNADLLWKYYTGTALIIHSVNPFAKKMMDAFDKWGEICCDLTVNDYAGQHFSMKEYYAMILDQVVPVDNRKTIDRNYVTALFEEESDIKQRIRVMVLQKEQKKAGKWNERCLGTLFLAVFLYMVYLSGAGVQACTDKIFAMTWGEMDISGQYTPPEEVEYEEEIEVIDEEEFVEIPQESMKRPGFMQDIGAASGEKDISIVLEPKETISSDYFSLQKGDTFSIRLLIIQEDQWIKIGYQTEKEKKPVVIKGKKHVEHTFTAEESGKYKLVIQNPENKEAELLGVIKIK